LNNLFFRKESTMNRFLVLLLCKLSLTNFVFAQQIIDKSDLQFLEGITRAVLDSSRIYPGQALVAPMGNNNTRGTLIRPGGRDTYPSFWIRDYAMSLETGFVTQAEQKHMLLLTAATQCDQTWITKAGTMVPYGAIADHIRVDDSKPIYYPGTYSYEEQGAKEFGMTPAYCDQYYFIHMADYYIKSTGDIGLLSKDINGTRLIDRLEIAFKVPPSRLDNGIVHTNDTFRGVDFGFRDAIAITGDLCFTSILKYVAAEQLAGIFTRLKQPEKAVTYHQMAQQLKAAIPGTFLDENGMLKASTGRSSQPDVWGTAMAVYLNLLEGAQQEKACRYLVKAYQQGNLAYRGSVRHILKGADFSEQTAWETAIVPKDQYQNGAYWGTATGWVSYAMAKVDPGAAKQLIKEYITELRTDDFRKGSNFSGPYECFHPSGYTRGPVYLTTVSCPFIVLRSMTIQ
jgi:hypothetical protein